VLASLSLRRALMDRRADSLEADTREIIVECGDGVRLLALETPAGTRRNRLAILIHGWEGSARSVYLVSAAAFLRDAGYDVVRLNLRDHGDSHHLNEGLFHSNRTAEVVGAVAAIVRQYRQHAAYLGGFSLGGNFALRVAARAPRAQIALAGVVAVCPVLDPRNTLAALEKGWFVYRAYFLGKWRRSLRRKAECHPALYDFGDLRRFRTLTAMTDFFVTGFTEYPDLEAYLDDYAITGDVLAQLEVPCHLLAAADDPVIPPADLSRLASPAALAVEVSASGGHCGFVERLSAPSWADRRMLDFFEAVS
jgi:hypothetical protein